MSLWHRTSAEVAGAWRSMRYDMGRRPAEPPAGGPDVTSTGMSTFGGQSWDFGPEPIERAVADRPAKPRRAALVSTFGLLTVLGAAGAYLVVVNGLVPLRNEKPAAAGTFPPRPPAVTADSGMGPSAPRPRRHPVAPAPAGAPALPEPAPPAPRHARPVRTVTPATPLRPHAGPPVPTPTAPPSAPSPTPSAPVSASASPSAVPSAPDTSGVPGKSPEPGSEWRTWHHYRYH